MVIDNRAIVYSIVLMNFRSSSLPREYVEEVLSSYVNNLTYKRNGDRFNGECPFCREGKSLGKKSRFWYYGESNSCYCFNCGYSNSDVGMVMALTGMSYVDVVNGCKDYDIIPAELKNKIVKKNIVKYDNIIDKLPNNSINLLNNNQVLYYNNFYINKAIEYINHRRLDTAVNKCLTFYMSLDDKIHKNRLVIPYYDITNSIVWYQTRRILDDNSPKYLSKYGNNKSLFNLNKIKSDIPYIFILEGAIDSMFILNATCCSGITIGEQTLTQFQKEQLLLFPFHKIIWVLDSPYSDITANDKQKYLCDNGFDVFKWPKEIGKKFKDINELCVRYKYNEFPYKFIIKNTYRNDFSSKIEELLNR